MDDKGYQGGCHKGLARELGSPEFVLAWMSTQHKAVPPHGPQASSEGGERRTGCPAERYGFQYPG